MTKWVFENHQVQVFSVTAKVTLEIPAYHIRLGLCLKAASYLKILFMYMLRDNR